MARQSSTSGVGAAQRSARAERQELEREQLFERFAELGPARLEARVNGRLGELPPIAALEQRLFDLWLARVVEQLRPQASDTFALARALIELTRSLTVTQRQTRIDVLDSFEDDDFSQRKMTILASGLCNCEMSNYIVWAALRKLGHLAYFFETGLRERLEGSHLLLYAFGPQGAAFVDAWSDVPCFHVPGFIPHVRSPRGRWLASRYGSRHPEGVPTHAELEAQGKVGIKTQGLYPAEAILAGGVRPAPRDDRHPWAATARHSADAAEQIPVEPLWRDYMALRLQHLEGRLEQPARAYEQFAIRDALPSKLRVVVSALAKRQAS